MKFTKLLAIFCCLIYAPAYSQIIQLDVPSHDICGEVLYSSDSTQLLFLSDFEDRWVLSDYAGFTAGDRIHLVGQVDNNCDELFDGFLYTCFTVEEIELCECSLPTYCCTGLPGNINGSENDEVDISDLVFYVEYMFGQNSGLEITCFEEADMDHSGVLDITDLITLVEYIFNIPFANPLEPCASFDNLPVTITYHNQSNFNDSLVLSFYEGGVVDGIYQSFPGAIFFGGYINTSVKIHVIIGFDYVVDISGTLCDSMFTVYETQTGFAGQWPGEQKVYIRE